MTTSGAALALILSASAVGGETVKEQVGVAYACDDVVVIGKLKNRDDYEHVDVPDDILGHGWMTATLGVRRQLKGSKVGRKITVRYFGHTYFREDAKFLFVLRPISDARFHIISARMMEGNPTLAEPCATAEQDEQATN